MSQTTKEPVYLNQIKGMNELKKVSWRSPSNIALVKYWGKHGRQLPNNPSISLTLDQCYSETSLSISEKETKGKDLELRFYFDKKENLAFRIKILKYFEEISKEFPFLAQYSIAIHSTNSFPHSSGIASSASSMSALALCLCEMEAKLSKHKKITDKDKFLQRASHFARLGSGSACRSIYPVASIWGETVGIKKSSDDHGIPAADMIGKVFKTYHNAILIASSEEKKVSSRVGHELMKTNPYAKTRYKQAGQHMGELLDAMSEEDFEKFGTIVETEAMTLHALMMCSQPNYMLMTPATVAMISKIKAFRESSKLPVYFTLDAGPNIHLLYPDKIKTKVVPFIDEELKPHCEGGRIIWDRVGKGPSVIK